MRVIGDCFSLGRFEAEQDNLFFRYGNTTKFVRYPVLWSRFTRAADPAYSAAGWTYVNNRDLFSWRSCRPERWRRNGSMVIRAQYRLDLGHSSLRLRVRIPAALARFPVQRLGLVN